MHCHAPIITTSRYSYIPLQPYFFHIKRKRKKCTNTQPKLVESTTCYDEQTTPATHVTTSPFPCYRTCGGGMRRRVRALCGWAWWKPEDKFRRCRKSASDSRQSEYCNTLCPHGTWSGWLGKCRCDDGYRGLCCQQRTYNPRSPCSTVDREYFVSAIWQKRDYEISELSEVNRAQ